MPLLLVLLMVIGLVLYLVPAHAKVNEIGRLMFACALLAFCLGHADSLSRFLR